MFDRVSELSKKTFATDASPSAEELDAGALESLLDDTEALQYVLASTGGIEYTTDDRTTTFEPGDGRDAYAAVSDRRIYFLLEGSPQTPEVTTALESVTSVDLRDGLLTTTLVVRTPDETVRFVPTDEEAARVAASYVSRIGTAWRELYDALSQVREALEAAEAEVTGDEDARRSVQLARSRLSNAHHCATQYDDAPTEQMRAEIEPVEAEVDGLRVDGRLDRVAERLADAREAREDDAYGAAFSAVVDASETLAAATDAVGDVDRPGVADRRADLAEELETVANDLLADAEAACHDALAAEDPTAAVESWDRALALYRATISADWDGLAGVSLGALRFQLAWVTGNLIAALAERASEREAAADELGEYHDDAADGYGRAHTDLTRANDLAVELPYADDDAFADRVEALSEKVERAKWQWGSAGG